jgi:hypothetical protein
MSEQKTETKTTDKRMVDIVITSKRFGSNPGPSLQTIRVPVIGNDAVRLDLTIDIRNTDTIEIRPVRRELEDVDGLVDDASRLANN